ncbi:hypothetical protein H5164_00580 [Shewanella sp. SG41-3]|nr:hypothetical protein [Shewanella sp. SG41-3]
MPVSDNISFYVHGGQLCYKTDYSVLGARDSTDDEGLFASVGISYHINESWTADVDDTLYDSDLNLDSATDDCATDDIDDANFSTDLK